MGEYGVNMGWRRYGVDMENIWVNMGVDMGAYVRICRDMW